MNKIRMIRFAAMLAAAACFGWLLPAAVFRVEDRVMEDRRETFQIRQYDLTYHSDLSAAARLSLIARPDLNTTMTSLERGIYLRKQDAADIARQFLQDLTGDPSAASARCELQPSLLSFEGEGTIIVWNVSCYLDGKWVWDGMIDDQTGMILKFQFHSFLQWDILFPELHNSGDQSDFLLSRISESLRRFYASRLSSDYTIEIDHEPQGKPDFESVVTMLRDGKPEFSFLLLISTEDCYIFMN